MDTTETINFVKLQKEFQNAKLAEERYNLENNAKFRAVHQKVSSYEEFRDIVASSHLQPLEKHDAFYADKTNGNMKVKPWNSFYSPSIDNENEHFQFKPPEICHHINNFDEFNKAWRCIKCPQTMCDIIISMDEFNLKSIFRCDLPSNVLETCIEQFSTMLTKENSAHIIKVLSIFSASRGFNIALRFLNIKQKEVVLKLLFSLESYGHDVKSLKTVYSF
uniref:Coiled-coil domain-containing protein 103 n=1 Tax=Hydra vulgaris TaxID=6087 RepID=T2MAL5_HYDVU|nr:coiled-coil domain-containing protein 103-like [Hydra vulgaris]